MESEYEKAQSLRKTSLFSFWISLGIGTALALGYVTIKAQMLILLGFVYVIAAGLFNIVIFINNIFFMCSHKEQRVAILLHTLLLLANIPIALLYLFIVFKS